MKKKSLEELNRISIDQFKKAEKLPVTIVLDNIRSMANVGSIFRLADAFLIEKIYLCGITAKPPHREIHKTALGSEESLDWQYFENVKDALDLLKQNKYSILGIEQTDKSIFLDNFNFENKKYAFIFGNEVEGVSYDALNYCENILEIPQFGTKHSLNVSNSVSIIIWEFYKSYKS